MPAVQPEILYAEWQGNRTCCAVMGDGPHEVLVAASFVSHLDLLLAHPSVRSWIREITRYARITMYDKLGVGLSDPATTLPTLEDRLAEIRAVRASAGLHRPVVLAVSEGASTGIAYAALHPDEVQSLVLASPFVGRGVHAEGWRAQPEIRQSLARYVERVDVAFRPTPDALNRLLEVFILAGTEWGTGRCLSTLIPSMGPTSQLALLERSVASPGMVRAVMSASIQVDGFALAEKVQVPTLILHARADIIPIEFSQELAARIPAANLVEIPGRDHVPWLNDEGMGPWVREFEQFVTGHASGTVPDRVLATVLFADVVGSTRQLAGQGDRRWRSVLESFDAESAAEVEHHGGNLVKSTGDGSLSTFTSPLAAVRCGLRLVEVAERFGIKVRVGLHTGEVEVDNHDIAGLAVHIAARILDRAGPSQVLVSRTVRDLVAGADLTFASHGEQELRGVPGTWEVLTVTDRGDIASIDTSLGARWYDRPIRAMARWRARGVTRTRGRTAP
jgi:class 3 adenylate cyclase